MEVPEGLPAVRFDRDALAQIVQNLLDNAEKYSRGSADRTIRVALACRPGSLVLSVADRGPGISERLRGSLFKPFARGPDPDAPPGLGLGLALVKALARAQGGEVSCLTGRDGGACFEVRFPA